MPEIYQYMIDSFSRDELSQSLLLATNQEKVTAAEQTVGLGSIAIKLMRENQDQNQELRLYIVGLCLLLIGMPSGQNKQNLKQRLADAVQYFYDNSILGRSETMQSLVVSLT